MKNTPERLFTDDLQDLKEILQRLNFFFSLLHWYSLLFLDKKFNKYSAIYKFNVTEFWLGYNSLHQAGIEPTNFRLPVQRPTD